MQLETPDKSLTFRLSLPSNPDVADNIHHIRLYAAMLLRYSVTALIDLSNAVGQDEFKPAESFPSWFMINSLIETKTNRIISTGELQQALEQKSFCTYYQLDYNAFPDVLSDIPYDPILTSLQGVLHGLHHLVMHQDDRGFYSPGQVLDISQLFDFISLNFEQLGWKEMRETLLATHRFFQRAKERGDALLITP
jgi:hypothetical protein